MLRRGNRRAGAPYARAGPLAWWADTGPSAVSARYRHGVTGRHHLPPANWHSSATGGWHGGQRRGGGAETSGKYDEKWGGAHSSCSVMTCGAGQPGAGDKHSPWCRALPYSKKPDRQKRGVNGASARKQHHRVAIRATIRGRGFHAGWLEIWRWSVHLSRKPRYRASSRRRAPRYRNGYDAGPSHSR